MRVNRTACLLGVGIALFAYLIYFSWTTSKRKPDVEFFEYIIDAAKID